MTGLPEAVLPESVLPEAVWRERAEAHAARADAFTAERRARSARGEKHPVWDFLFTYYPASPTKLARWHPGAGAVLEGAVERRTWRGYAESGARDARVDAAAWTARDPRRFEIVAKILRGPLVAAPRFGCFGLHEWAMVYRAPETRHDVPLRLGAAGTDRVVEAHDLRCTHLDAFRFFTPEAAPRNATTPTRAEQPTQEQAGCLHAGMDVYKWALQLGPLVPGEVLLDAFELARDIRALDMRASPYDLEAWGFAPVPIETPEGKAAYVAAQRGFAERGNALRRRVLAAWLGDAGRADGADGTRDAGGPRDAAGAISPAADAGTAGPKRAVRAA